MNTMMDFTMGNGNVKNLVNIICSTMSLMDFDVKRDLSSPNLVNGVKGTIFQNGGLQVSAIYSDNVPVNYSRNGENVLENSTVVVLELNGNSDTNVEVGRDIYHNILDGLTDKNLDNSSRLYTGNLIVSSSGLVVEGLENKD